MVNPGDKAPNLILKTIDEQPMALAETWRTGKNVLLVFLRHLG